LQVTLINFITALSYLVQALGGTDIQGHNVGSVLSVYNPARGGYTNPNPTVGSPAAVPTNARAFMWVRYAAWIFVAPLTMVILGLPPPPSPPPSPSAGRTTSPSTFA
jgi:bacteriorhodopsin